MHIFPPFLILRLHYLFQYVNIFLAGVNVALVIWCLIVCLGFELLDLLIQICHSPLISLLKNYPGPFFLFVIFVCNWCIIASNRCIITTFLRSTHFCSTSTFWQAAENVSVEADVWETFFWLQLFFFPGRQPSPLVLLVMIPAEMN